MFVISAQSMAAYMYMDLVNQRQNPYNILSYVSCCFTSSCFF